MRQPPAKCDFGKLSAIARHISSTGFGRFNELPPQWLFGHSDRTGPDPGFAGHPVRPNGLDPMLVCANLFT
jgi:hypothetical protein